MRFSFRLFHPRFGDIFILGGMTASAAARIPLDFLMKKHILFP